MQINHKAIDVPRVSQYPDPSADYGDDGFPMVDFVNFILSEAISHAPAIVEAERPDRGASEVRWQMRSRTQAFLERTVAEMPASMFRSALACFNASYLDGQLYGGCIRTRLRQGKREVTAALFTTNEGPPGSGFASSRATDPAIGLGYSLPHS
jgi:hypothetical protein